MSASLTGLILSILVHVAVIVLLGVSKATVSSSSAQAKSAVALNTMMFMPIDAVPEPVPEPVKVSVEHAVPTAQKIQTFTTSGLHEIDPAYLDRLRAEILKNRTYPRQARRKKQQGTVTISFKISFDGKISQVKTLNSSGIASLDKAAVKAVAAIGRFEAFPDNSGTEPKVVTVQIIFKLR